MLERGPLALFGAIIAVGLGPAMWLGVQFGSVAGTPTRPPAVTVQDNSRGGVGAAAPDDETDTIKTDPKSNVEPLGAPKPVRSSANPSTSASPTPSRSVSESPTPPGEEDSTPPTEATPPAGDDPSEDTSGNGGDTGAGNGDTGDDGPAPAPPSAADDDDPSAAAAPAV